MTTKLFFAGSGGQGILTMGQMVAYGAMAEEKPVTFLPSYGPEMRGGTSNCTVVVSDDKPVSCPVIYEADAVVVMNLPSLLKFESMVKPGGKLFVNSSIIDQKPTRDDIEIIYVPTMELAEKCGSTRTANIVMWGALVRGTGVISYDSAQHVMEKVFSGSKAKFLPMDKLAFDAYQG